MKIRCYIHYVHHVKGWKELTRNPGKHLRRWACADRRTDNATSTTRGASNSTTCEAPKNLKGLLWVKVGTAERLVTASGVRRDGMQWYMESMQFAAPLPAPWLANPVVEWVVQGMYEEDEKYIMRAYSLQTGMGIVRSVWQYGMRRPGCAKDTGIRP